MKKSILIPLLFLCIIPFATAQKISSLDYKLKSVDSTYAIKAKVFSDENIQKKSNKLFSTIIPNKSIISIEDNINRRFDKINFKNIDYYSKLLNEGYYNLYELKVNDKPTYIICSKNDTVILEKNDSIIDHAVIRDRNYNNKLVFLCKDYPELLSAAEKVSFKKNDLQNLISALNEKHGGINIKRPVKNKIDFLSLSLSGIINKNKTYFNLGILKSQYFLNLSTNLSFKYGLVASYYHKMSYFPDLTPGWSFFWDTEEELQNFYNAHKNDHDTSNDMYLRFPLMFNYEITNSMVTPYVNIGVEPLLYSQKLTRSYSNKIDKSNGVSVLAIAAVGVKVKLTNSFNIKSELGLSGLNFGIEYFLKP